MSSSNSRKEGTLARGPERGDLVGVCFGIGSFLYGLSGMHMVSLAHDTSTSKAQGQ